MPSPEYLEVLIEPETTVLSGAQQNLYVEAFLNKLTATNDFLEI